MGVRFLGAFMHTTRDRWQEFRKVYWKRPTEGNGLKYETCVFKPIQSYQRLIRKTMCKYFQFCIWAFPVKCFRQFAVVADKQMKCKVRRPWEAQSVESQNENKYAAKHPEQNTLNYAHQMLRWKIPLATSQMQKIV